jgi:hypothetical protein
MVTEWWGRLPFVGVGSRGRLVVALLAADSLFAWMVLMGVVTYVNRVWYAPAGHALPQAGLAELGRADQVLLREAFRTLGWLQRGLEELFHTGVIA